MKSLSILTLTGWSQAEDALDSVLPPGAQVTHFPYQQYPDLPDVYAALKALPAQPDVVFGWSLGGRIAAQAIAKRHIIPRYFIQMSSVFRFVAGSGLDNAAEKEFYGFHSLFRESPKEARERLANVIVSGDAHAEDIRKLLHYDMENNDDWSRWLVSSRFGADEINFSAMPPTLIIHGENDRLVSLSHSLLYKERMPHARLEVIPGCGHAPHLHDPEKIRKMVRDELASL